MHMRSSSKPACSAWKPNMWPKVWASSHFTIGFVKFKPHFGFTKLTVNISKSLVILLSVAQFMAAFFFLIWHCIFCSGLLCGSKKTITSSLRRDQTQCHFVFACVGLSASFVPDILPVKQEARPWCGSGKSAALLTQILGWAVAAEKAGANNNSRGVSSVSHSLYNLSVAAWVSHMGLCFIHS